jgi:putative flippase GtrA
MTSQQVFTLVLIAAGAIAFLVAFAWGLRWYFNRQIPADSQARRPLTKFGKLHALAYVFCLVVGVLLVSVFPDGWLAKLLEIAGPFFFGMIVITPALVLGFVLETRGVKFYRNGSDDA